MSDIIKALEESRKIADDLDQKQFKVHQKRVEIQYKKLEDLEKKTEAFDNLPIGKNIAERYNELAKENTEYIKLARKSDLFLGLDAFKDKVALFPRNLILLSAETGTGKSTTVANYAESLIKKGKKILIITNEEYPTDILNRILFLINDWDYSHHDKVTDYQLQKCEELYPVLGKSVEVIHDSFNGIGGTTTTVEGIKSITKNLLEALSEGVKYDAILIDYIQNVSTSLEVPSMAKWQVMQTCMTHLDNFKGLYPAPITVFSQLKKGSDGDSYKDRIEGFKAILNHATTAIEIKIDRENLRSEFIFVKNRFKGAVGDSVFVGFNKGRYVPYDQEFKNKAKVYTDKKQHSLTLSNMFKTDKK